MSLFVVSVVIDLSLVYFYLSRHRIDRINLSLTNRFPEKMRVASGLTDVHDVDDLLRHACFVRISVSLVQFLLDEVEGK